MTRQTTRPTTRLTAATLGAGALLLATAGTASAAPLPGVPGGPGSPAPHPGGTPTHVLPGVAAPLPDPSLGVPEVLEVAIVPFAALADLEGSGGGTAPSPQGAQGTPGSTEV